jgi:glutaredoxin 3
LTRRPALVLELYGTATCPYTAELREELDWQGREYVEFDIETDAEALARVRALTAGAVAVPVLVENGQVLQIGYHGRSCYAPG